VATGHPGDTSTRISLQSHLLLLIKKLNHLSFVAFLKMCEEIETSAMVQQTAIAEKYHAQDVVE